MSGRTHLIGLLLGTEEDWPTVFEALVPRVGTIAYRGERHSFATERITIEPFGLRDRPRHALVIDRLSYWYFQPREWLKKVALMDDVYLLNNPFTFQSMEKHAAYCAMIRCGFKVPETWLLPHKHPLENPRWTYTTAKYNREFDLDAIAEAIGYPLYMKPFDGGQWVGVTRIADSAELHRRYDESGHRLMHLQASLEDFEVFARSLSIGAETMVMRFDPAKPLHDRYRVDHSFLSPELGREIVSLGKVVNAFFHWEFNSCETIVKDGQVYPIDYANAWPDVALTSLHYYFPWALRALVRWSVFCTASDRRMQIDMRTRRYFELGDGDLPYEEKLEALRALADAHFETAEYEEFCAEHLAHLDELVLEYFESPEFDTVLVDTIRGTFPAHEHDGMVEHYRGLVGAWARDERTAAA